MLLLCDSAGLDLLATPPAPVVVALSSPLGTPVTIQLYGTETGTALAPVYLCGTVNWNDGGSVDVFPYTLASNGTIAMTAQRRLALGYHTIGVYLHNYRAPVMDELQVNFSVTVVTTGNNAPLRHLYGPILPRDGGFPNASQWNFDLSADAAVLASSVKMLVETRIGERIMEPAYGTDIRSILFEANVSGIEALVQEKLTQALLRWEPRVTLQYVTVNRNERCVSLSMGLESRLSGQAFSVVSVFSL